ncbi:MAG: hypothetical protein A2X53_16625 [Candidatus Rokubacteria bacterium GWA2_70_23]|nr:MAG: hypothetical protein A2X53_16625 [Candidatus Rokubacteria bacterium GWA2_70_23]
MRPEAESGGDLREATCPACGHHGAVGFFDGGAQPLATLGWPPSAEQARAMPRLRLDFVRCVDCGHVFNAAFDYAAVPYSDKPNLMFNRSAGWSDHLRALQQRMLSTLPERPVVVEIGHGDGHFLRALAAARPAGRYVGFDPHGAPEAAAGPVELRRALFVSSRHVADYRPDLIMSRHVLEHLGNPLGFIQSLSFAAAWAEIHPALFLEVPCIDRALATGRTVDFYYEHNSHFTTESFMRMLSRSGVVVDFVGHGYNGEVVYGFVRLGKSREQIERARASLAFGDRASRAGAAIRRQLEELWASGRSVAVWGGTGKSAAFMNQMGMDAIRFPVVVDSDRDKAGTFVPGTGQEIRSRDWLLAHPADVVIIPPQWRAGDIVREMAGCGIRPATVLIEFDGRLADYFADSHPYRPGGEPARWALEAVPASH